jgi:hypothetical protein
VSTSTTGGSYSASPTSQVRRNNVHRDEEVGTGENAKDAVEAPQRYARARQEHSQVALQFEGRLEKVQIPLIMVSPSPQPPQRAWRSRR